MAPNPQNRPILFDSVRAAKLDSEFMNQKQRNILLLIFHGQIKITNCICVRRIQTKKNRNKESLQERLR